MSVVRYRTPHAALAAEAALAGEFDRRHCTRIYSLWATSRCLVVPRSASRKANFEEACERSRAEGWPVFVRRSGGSVVFQDHGTINLSVFLDPNGASLESVYRRVGTPIIDALGDFGVDACFGALPGSVCDGRYNVLIAGKKFAGMSQYWPAIKRKGDGPESGGVLTHAVCFVDSDMVAGIAAVDKFSRSLDLPAGFESSRHVTIESAAPTGRQALVNDFAARLRSRLQSNGWKRSDGRADRE